MIFYYEVSKDLIWCTIRGKHANIIKVFDARFSSKYPIALCYSEDVAESMVDLFEKQRLQK